MILVMIHDQTTYFLYNEKNYDVYSSVIQSCRKR